MQESEQIEKLKNPVGKTTGSFSFNLESVTQRLARGTPPKVRVLSEEDIRNTCRGGSCQEEGSYCSLVTTETGVEVFQRQRESDGWPTVAL